MKKLIATVAITGAFVVGTAGVAGADASPKWQRYAQASMPHVTALQSDMEAVSAAAQATNITGTETACTNLGETVDSARSTLTHSPSKRLNRIMREALTKFRVATIECLAGDYTSAAVSITEGATTISDATDIVAAHR